MERAGEDGGGREWEKDISSHLEHAFELGTQTVDCSLFNSDHSISNPGSHYQNIAVGGMLGVELSIGRGVDVISRRCVWKVKKPLQL